MANKAFNQAIYSLLHPVSITAIGLLLWNDHWLRLQYPSWWSGKIGDFAWLVFAPLIGAAVLAWLIPQRLKNHQRMVGLLAFFIIGMWFCLAKTVPAVHALTVAAWGVVIGGPVSLRLDPSDLVTLPALWLGWRVWQRAKAPTLKRSHLAPIIFAVGIVATLGNGADVPFEDTSPAAPRVAGVNTVCWSGTELHAYTTTREYSGEYNGEQKSGYMTEVVISEDGGLTWLIHKFVKSDSESPDYSEELKCSKPENKLQDTGNIQYRWQPAQSIERSTDGGQSWIVEYDLYQLRQEVRRIYRNPDAYFRSVKVSSSPGPRGGLVDPVTGNVIFAMGQDGVLVRTRAGTWYWVPVGDYRLDDISSLNRAVIILFFEFWEAVALIVLVLTTSSAYIHYRSVTTFRRVLLAAGWLGWAIIAILLLPDFHRSSDSGTIICIASPLFMLGGVLTISALRDFLGKFRSLLLPVLGTGFAAALLYYVPLVFWTQGTIARYTTAMQLALLLSTAALLAGYSYLRPVLPTIKPPPAPTNDNHAETATTDQAKP